MAKGPIISLMKGKLGQIVLYKVTNSNNKQTQGARAYVAEVANPQTAAQNAQRMKLAPAANFYRGLAEILDHSWQGVKYGNDSRQYFMKMALSNANEVVFPFVLKGEKRFVPGEYPISRGSIAPVFITNVDNTLGAISSLSQGADFDGATPFGELIASILQANPTLMAEDQLTVVGVFEHDGSYYPLVRRILLNITDLGDSNAVSFVSITRQNGLDINSDGENLTFRFGSIVGESPTDDWQPVTDTMVGAAVIISRHSGDGNQTGNWLRSAADLYVTDAFLSQWMSSEQYANAIASYSKATTSASSDKYLNQSGEENQGSSMLYNETVSPNTLFTGLSSGYPQAEVAVLYNANDGKSYYIINVGDRDGDYSVYKVNAAGSLVLSYNIYEEGVTPRYDYISSEEAENILGKTSDGGNRYPAPAPSIPSDSGFLSLETIDVPETIGGVAGPVSYIVHDLGNNDIEALIPTLATGADGTLYPQQLFKADGLTLTTSAVILQNESNYTTLNERIQSAVKAKYPTYNLDEVLSADWQNIRADFDFLRFVF